MTNFLKKYVQFLSLQENLELRYNGSTPPPKSALILNTDIQTLTHYHIMPHFDALKICICEIHCEKRRNCLSQAISPFLSFLP